MIWSLVGAPIELACGGRILVRASLGAGLVNVEIDPGPNPPDHDGGTFTGHEARRVRVLLDAAISIAERGAA